MKILLNGNPHDVRATRLDSALDELGYRDATIATALNETFVPAPARATTDLAEGDRLEVVAPRQGG